jgi:hypothetical protein
MRSVSWLAWSVSTSGIQSAAARSSKWSLIADGVPDRFVGVVEELGKLLQDTDQGSNGAGVDPGGAGLSVVFHRRSITRAADASGNPDGVNQGYALSAPTSSFNRA